MTVESGTTIEDFEPNWPLPDDDINEGDGHITLIKQILQSQFPGEAGDGFAEVILSNETELNYSQGLIGNIQAQIDAIITGTSGALNAPVNTVMIFGAGDIPPGWTKLDNVDDAVLRMMHTEDAGVTGGFVSIIAMPFVHDHVSNPHTLIAEEVPEHNHTMFADFDSNVPIELGTTLYAATKYDAGTDADQQYIIMGTQSPTPTLGKTSSFGGSLGHNHGNTQNNPSSDIIEPKYINVQQAIKT